MKPLVNALAVAVRRIPWVIIGLTIVISMVLGSFASKFVPSDDNGFAPGAPELIAFSTIAETFGTESVLQVLTSSSTGDVITFDGFVAAVALEETLRASDVSDVLVDRIQAPAIVSYMAPVMFAIQDGAPEPTDDAQVKALYTSGMEGAPPEFQGFLSALVSDEADVIGATAEYGLTAVSYASSDDQTEAGAISQSVADAVAIAPTPSSITNDAFSADLIFASSDDFEQEIQRLFVSAMLIILLVLGLVYLVKPRDVKGRLFFVFGLLLMISGVLVAVLPGLALIFPDVFPASWGEVELVTVLLTSLSLYAVAFLLWTAGGARLRRTTADTLLTFLTILFAINWMNGYGYLRFENQTGMAQILPILLIGLGVDYAIHMTTRYRQELASGRSVDESVSMAIRTVGIALVLATLTTAVGFLTNVTNSIPALAEFGELAAIGIGASFLLMLTFVPAVRELLDRRAETHGRLDPEPLRSGESRILPRIIGKTAVLPRKFAAVTVLAAVLLTGLAGYGMSGLSTEFSFLDFVPTTSPLRPTAIVLTERFDFPESTSVLVEGDIASGDVWSALFASSIATAGVDSVQFITTESGTDFPIGRSLTSVVLQWISPDSESFDASLAQIAEDVGLDEAFLAPPAADLTPLYDAAFSKDPDAMAGVLSSTPAGYVSALYRFDTTAGESGALTLADSINAAFAPVVAAGATAVTTSNFIINSLVVDTLKNSQVSSLLLTLGAALLLLMIYFWFDIRRPMVGVLTTLPVAMVVIWVFGLMAAFGIPFGPVTATISALGIGIGIPYMIHVTHRFLEERRTQADENEAVEQTLTHTGGALAGSAVTTVAGFGILTISTTIPFRQFGFVLSYTILLALFAAVLVLPSMLVLWDRWHRRRGEDPTLGTSSEVPEPGVG